MRPTRLGTALAFFLLLLSSAGTAFAAHIHNLWWSSPTYYQGDGGSVTFEIFNDDSGSRYYAKLILQFDWENTTGSSFQTGPSQSKSIPWGHVANFTVQFSIPAVAGVGNHLYSLYYVDASNKTSPVGQEFIYVHDSFERAYRNLLSEVGRKITTANSTLYGSPVARSLLLEADGNYTRAITLAGEGQYQKATSLLSEAASTLSQANSVEQTYTSSVSTSRSSSKVDTVSVTSQQTSATENWYSQPLVLSGAGIAAALAAIGTISVVRRKRPTH